VNSKETRKLRGQYSSEQLLEIREEEEDQEEGRGKKVVE